MSQSNDRDLTPASSEAKVVDISQFRRKKAADEEFARGRQPLYVSHLTGKVTGQNPEQKDRKEEGFGDRLSRIRSSLDKINRLMSELKRMSTGAEPEQNNQSSSKKQK